MTKQEAIIEAQAYANVVKEAVLVLRRGKDYKVSKIHTKNWVVAEIVSPNVPLPSLSPSQFDELRAQASGSFCYRSLFGVLRVCAFLPDDVDEHTTIREMHYAAA